MVYTHILRNGVGFQRIFETVSASAMGGWVRIWYHHVQSIKMTDIKNASRSSPLPTSKILTGEQMNWVDADGLTDFKT